MGARGEFLASKFLQNKGYQILEFNLTSGRCEIDLVCLDIQHQELVFVEVKTRSSNQFGHPSLVVQQAKIRSLKKVARAYLKSSNLDLDWRFDIISVLPGKIEHFENITWYN